MRDMDALDVQGEADLHQLVSDEELARLTVPDGLTDLERAKLYLDGEQAVQLRALVDNLPGLARGAGRGAWRVVAAVADRLPALDEEAQLAAAEAFASLARGRLLAPHELAELLPAVLGGAVPPGARASPLQQAWLACLRDLAPALEAHTLRAKLLPLVLARGPGGAAGMAARCLSCQLLGLLAPHLSHDEIERTLVRAAAAMCQDTEWQVRRAMCEQLPAIAAAAAGPVGPPPDGASQQQAQPPPPQQQRASRGSHVGEAILGTVLAEVLVRVAAWRALAALLPLLGPEPRRRAMLPALLRQAQLPDRHVEMQRALAGTFGELAGRLLPEVASDGDANTLLSLFRSLAARDDPPTREACAAALPAMLRGAGSRRYGSHMHDALLLLVGDAEAPVRRAVAAGFSALATLLGRDRCGLYLRQPLGALLRDEDPAVVRAVVGGLRQALPLFAAAPAPPAADPGSGASTVPAGTAPAAADAAQAGSSPAPSSSAPAHAAGGSSRGCAEFVEPLLRLEVLSGRDWRLQLELLRLVGEGGGALFPPDAMSDRLAPIALRYLAEGPAALRGPAAEAAAEAWRAARRPTARTALYGRAVRELALARCCRGRAAFVDFCCATLRRFSSRFFKAHLLEACLVLALDPVAAVVALPDDVGLLELLNSAMSRLITDRDAEVARAARKASANDEYKRQPVRMSCGALEGSSAEVKAYEAADAARAEGERDWAFDPEGLDRIRAEVEAQAASLRAAAGLGPVGALASAGRAGGAAPGGVGPRGEACGGGGRPGASPGRQGWAGGGARAAGAGAAGDPRGSAGHQRSTSDPDSPGLARGRPGARPGLRGSPLGAGGAGGARPAPAARVRRSISEDLHTRASPARPGSQSNRLPAAGGNGGAATPAGLPSPLVRPGRPAGAGAKLLGRSVSKTPPPTTVVPVTASSGSNSSSSSGNGRSRSSPLAAKPKTGVGGGSSGLSSVASAPRAASSSSSSLRPNPQQPRSPSSSRRSDQHRPPR
eukprot:scaffold22.g6144.t1